MAAIDYQHLLNLITGLAPNADEAAKKNVLTQVSNALYTVEEPDIELRNHAFNTKMSLQFGQNANMDGWIRAELAQYIGELQAKGAVQQPVQQPEGDQDVAMDGGRKKRRYRKRTRKTKKQTTRRR